MKTILLVEDDPFLIDIYSQKLKKAGFEVTVAEDGQKALDALQQKKPDLLLLDIVLPEMAGWEVLRKVKGDANLADLKIVILSNLGQKEDVDKGLGLGVAKYLIKAHYTPKEVVEEIKKILE